MKLDIAQSGAAALLYSTYIGGMGQETPHSLAVDDAGNVYVTGATLTTDFPTVNPIQNTFGGGTMDVFVTKLNATASALVYSTYLGGGGDDVGYAIAVDTAGNAYLTGYTGSGAWPTADPLRPRSGGWESFITKIAEPDPVTESSRFYLPVVQNGSPAN
jgi:hypothetical protein